MKKYIQDYAMLFTIAGILVFLDQWTKTLVRTYVPVGTVYRPDLWISQYARILNWKNTGAAFGLFQNMSDVFTVLSFIVSGVILYYFPQVPRREWYLRLAMCLQLGGAVGNLIDRLARGHVTDFISVGNFPVFNVADSCISVGVAVLVIGMWWQDRKRKPSEGSPGAEETPPAQESKPPPLSRESQGE